MNLLQTFDGLLEQWREVFPQERTFQRARRLVFGMLFSLRLHLTSHAICATGRQFQDWTADYRVCSRSPWDPHRLFDAVLDRVPELLPSATAPVMIALDDTMVKKTGRRIPGLAWGRDPLSPPFHVNLQYGLRFVQVSVLVAPAGGGPARALPVRFEPAPPAIKPKPPRKPKNQEAAAAAEKPAPDEAYCKAMADYKEERKLKRLPQVGLKMIGEVRKAMNARPGLCNRHLIVASDATNTTGLTLRELPAGTTYIGRIRKDARLHWPLPPSPHKTNGRPRRYGPQAPTPDQIRQDETIPWQKVRCFAAGEFRQVEVKVVKAVYWRKSGVALPLQVVVIRAAGYRLTKHGKVLYRHPAYLISTDPDLPLETLVQAYIYRWEIECNHRDEKSLLGVAKGQVRNPHAVRRLPQMQVASYSLLLLASLLSSGFLRKDGDYLPLPKWRRPTETARPSLPDLLNLLRDQSFARDLNDVGFDDFTDIESFAAKPPKPPLSPQILATLAA